MATGANIDEEYSISDARSGSIRVSRLVLTGWGATPSASAGLKAWSDRGRVWGVFTYSSANSGDFSLRRRGPGLYAATDEICSGTVADGKVTLTADNTSGITGTADVDDGTPGTNPQADATFDVILSYNCDENDIAVALDGASSFLDSNSKYQGQLTRFERLLLDSKRKVDQWLFKAYENRMRYDAYGRPMLAHVVSQGALSRCQALMAAYQAQLSRIGLIEIPSSVKQILTAAEAEFNDAHVAFDWERDLAADSQDRGVNRVLRA